MMKGPTECTPVPALCAASRSRAQPQQHPWTSRGSAQLQPAPLRNGQALNGLGKTVERILALSLIPRTKGTPSQAATNECIKKHGCLDDASDCALHRLCTTLRQQYLRRWLNMDKRVSKKMSHELESCLQQSQHGQNDVYLRDAGIVLACPMGHSDSQEHLAMALRVLKQ